MGDLQDLRRCCKNETATSFFQVGIGQGGQRSQTASTVCMVGQQIQKNTLHECIQKSLKVVMFYVEDNNGNTSDFLIQVSFWGEREEIGSFLGKVESVFSALVNQNHRIQIWAQSGKL